MISPRIFFVHLNDEKRKGNQTMLLNWFYHLRSQLKSFCFEKNEIIYWSESKLNAPCPIRLCVFSCTANGSARQNAKVNRIAMVMKSTNSTHTESQITKTQYYFRCSTTTKKIQHNICIALCRTAQQSNDRIQ